MRAENENENENEDALLEEMQQGAVRMAMNAARSYYGSAKSLIVDGGHTHKEAVWQNPAWWCQMMMMVLLEEARSAEPGGRLPHILSENVRTMLDTVDEGTALFKIIAMTTHTKQ